MDIFEELRKVGAIAPKEEGNKEPVGEDNKPAESGATGAQVNDNAQGDAEVWKQKYNALKTSFSVEKDEDIVEIAKTYKERIAEADKLKSDYATVMGMVEKAQDPSSYFSSPEAYKREQLLKSNPSLGVDVAEKVVAADLQAMPDKEAIKLELRMKYPQLSKDEDLEEYINDKYGIEEGDEPSKLALNKMMIDATAAKAEISRVRSELKEPEKIDLEKFRQQALEGNEALSREVEAKWNGEIGTITESKTITIKDDDGKDIFSYAIDDEFIAAAKVDAVNLAKSNLLKVTDEAKAYLREQIEAAYFIKNRAKIVKAAQEQAVADYKSALDREKAGFSDVARENTNHQPSGDPNQRFLEYLGYK